MIKGNHLAMFIESFNTYQLIYTHPYLDLYDGWFSEKTDNLIAEVNEELLLFSKEQQADYLRMVKYKLDTNTIFINNPSLFLQKWVEKYGLEGLDFPFTANRQILMMLSVTADQVEGYQLKKDITNMQIDFFCYSASLEYQRTLDFIDSLFHQEEKVEQMQTVEKKSETPTEITVEKPVTTPVEVSEDKPKSIMEKWFALHYLLEQKSLGLKIPVTREGAFNKAELEKIGKQRSGRKGQGFYRKVKEFADDVDTKASIERSFGKDWKTQVIELSKDNAYFSKFLDENY